MRKTKIDSDVCVLLVIDVQNDFCSPDGVKGRKGWDASDAVNMVTSSLAPFISAARSADVPIVWIRTDHDETTDTMVWMSRASLYLETTPEERRPANCVTGTWGAEFFHVAPEAGEPVITKSRHSSFVGTNLDLVLKVIGRPSLLLTGVSTNACVESTLRDALYRDYHVVLVEDCCAGSDRASHDATVANVGKRFGPVVTSHEITEAWTRAGAATAGVA